MLLRIRAAANGVGEELPQAVRLSVCAEGFAEALWKPDPQLYGNR